jgi:hypothetical protein
MQPTSLHNSNFFCIVDFKSLLESPKVYLIMTYGNISPASLPVRLFYIDPIITIIAIALESATFLPTSISPTISSNPFYNMPG